MMDMTLTVFMNRKGLTQRSIEKRDKAVETLVKTKLEEHLINDMSRPAGLTGKIQTAIVPRAIHEALLVNVNAEAAARARSGSTGRSCDHHQRVHHSSSHTSSPTSPL
jgi:hypothetical protein